MGNMRKATIIANKILKQFGLDTVSTGRNADKDYLYSVCKDSVANTNCFFPSSNVANKVEDIHIIYYPS